MRAEASLYPPESYHGGWLVLGCALLVVIAGWYGWLFWTTRAARPPESPTPPPTDVTGLRMQYLKRIDDVERRADAGELDLRGVHQELSVVVRNFVHEASGSRAHVMTLAGLRDSDERHGRLAPVIESYYPPAFMASSVGDIARAITAARALVDTWF